MLTLRNQLIIPWHTEFAQANTALAARIERFCQNPPTQVNIKRRAVRLAGKFHRLAAHRFCTLAPSRRQPAHYPNVFFGRIVFNWVAKTSQQQAQPTRCQQ